LSLKINLAKSKPVPVGNVDHVEGLASILGCGVFVFAFEVSRLLEVQTYLGRCY